MTFENKETKNTIDSKLDNIELNTNDTIKVSEYLKQGDKKTEELNKLFMKYTPKKYIV